MLICAFSRGSEVTHFNHMGFPSDDNSSGPLNASSRSGSGGGGPKTGLALAGVATLRQ
jgi:hypothetical protein